MKYSPMDRRQKLKDHGYNEAVIELVEYLPMDEIDLWTDHLLEASDQVVQRMNYYRKKMKDQEETPPPIDQHVLTYTITLQKDTPKDQAEIIRNKTLVVLEHFLTWMSQPDCTIGSSLEIN